MVKGPTRQRPWFRPPPKVRIVPRILGWMPGEETRVIDQPRGEWEVRDGGVSSMAAPSRVATPSSSSSLENPPSPNPNTSLSKFVGHFWRGGPAKSFAAAVRFHPAEAVWVKMSQGGPGRNFYGPGRGGGSGGRSGWGGGGGGS